MGFHLIGRIVVQQLLRIRQVEELTGLSRYSIYRYMAQGDFPRQVKLGSRAVAWKADDLRSWLDSRKQVA